MAATTLGFIPLQLIPTNAIGHYNFDKGFPANGTYVVVKTPTVAQQLQLTKSLKEMQNGGKEINNNENCNNKPVLLRCKRRVDFTGLGCKLVDSATPSVSRRNERERKRVKMVNMGFETLRQHVPVGRKNKKMSKVETLRSAVQYIKQLQEMLDANDGDAENPLLENVDMDELENKVTEMIQNANDSNNNMNIDNGLDLSQENMHNMNISQNVDLRLESTTSNYYSEQNSRTPECSPDIPQSPNHTQGHFFQSYQNCQTIYTTQYDNVSTSSAAGSVMSYSQASPAGSLHSPTSSVVSDSSYDSVGHEDEDMLAFSTWF